MTLTVPDYNIRSTLGRALTSAEFDENWTETKDFLQALLDDGGFTGRSIDSIAVSGDAMSITLDDDTVLGPFTLPKALFNPTGIWVTATGYAVQDVVTHGGAGYCCLVAHTSGTFSVDLSGGKWALLVDKGEAGGAINFFYTFSSATSNADPGAGKVSLNNATQTSATAVYISDTDIAGDNLRNLIISFNNGTSAIKGLLRLYSKADPSKWIAFSASAFNLHTGYTEITVVELANPGIGTTVLTDLDQVGFTFSPVGDKGAQGIQGIHGGALTFRYTFSTTTTNADPGTGKLRLNNATQSSATAIYCSTTDADSHAITALLDILDDSTSTPNAYVLLRPEASSTSFVAGTLTVVTSHSGYREIAIAVTSSSGASALTDLQSIVMTVNVVGNLGNQGLTGSGIAIDYTFSTTTTNSDPGNGVLRLNNATQTSAVAIYADLLDTAGTTWTTVLDTLDDSSSTIKGFIRLVKKSDASKWLEFTISAVVSQSGYRELTVTNVAGSAASPFANSDAIVLTFTRTGDKGDTGTTGTGLPGGGVVIEYAFSTTTAGADPGNGVLRLNNATQTSATRIYADLLDSGGTTWTTVLDALDDSTSAVKGFIRLVKKLDVTKWLTMTISAVTTQTGYREITVANIAGSSSTPFADTDVILLEFTRTGDKGDTGSPYTTRINTFSPSGAAVTVDWTSTDQAIVTLTDSTTTFTFTGAVDGQKCTLKLIQGSGGNKLVTLPATVAYGSDVTAAPTLTVTAAKEDYLGFIFDNTASKYRMTAYARGY